MLKLKKNFRAEFFCFFENYFQKVSKLKNLAAFNNRICEGQICKCLKIKKKLEILKGWFSEG